MIRFETLLEKVRAYSPESDLELLRRAYVFSALEHKGQVRHSGEPYLVHPLEVASLLADMRLDVVMERYEGTPIAISTAPIAMVAISSTIVKPRCCLRVVCEYMAQE